MTVITVRLSDAGAELRGCVNVEVVVQGYLSLIILKVSVDVKRHWT